MGRGKVELKLIQDKSNRQVTFSKRRSGMMKKAKELSVLCDVEVALFIFSPSGRFYDFSSGDSLKKILERYQTHSNQGGDACKCVNPEKYHSECTCLCTATNQLEMVKRQLEGKNIEELNITELIELEKQLDTVLRVTRSRKTELMMEAVTALHEKEKQLTEENNQMEKEIADDARISLAGEDDGTDHNAFPSFNWL